MQLAINDLRDALGWSSLERGFDFGWVCRVERSFRQRGHHTSTVAWCPEPRQPRVCQVRASSSRALEGLE